MKEKLLSVARFIFGWPLTLVAFFFLYRIISPSFEDISLQFSSVNIFLLLLSFFFFSGFFILRSLFWQKLLEIKNYKIPYKKTAYFWELSELKRYIPGTFFSFLGRAFQFEKLKVKKSDTGIGILFEAQFFALSGIILSLFSLPFFFLEFLGFNLPPEFYRVIILTVLFITIIFIFNKFFLNDSIFTKILPRFSGGENLLLLTISIFYLLFFSLGTYFSFLSFTFLDPGKLTLLLSFFSLSFTLSFLAILFPTGLGLREALLTVGLSAFIAAPQAAFGAIFARIVLIGTELIFLLSSYVWFNSNNKLISKLENFVSNNMHALVLGSGVVVYNFYFSIASFLKYRHFYMGKFDLGNMDQTVWNTINGRFFQLTDPNGTETVSRLAYHSDFILLFFSPLYFIWSDPNILLFSQTLILSLGAVFVYLISKEVLKEKTISLVFALLFLLNPAVQFTNLYDFHAVTLGTTFLLASFYFLIKKKYLPMIVFLLLACFTKEQIWAVASLFGLYIAFFQKNKSLGISVFSFFVIMFFFVVSYAIPAARGGEHFALEYYSEFGSSPFEIAKNILLSPDKVLETITQEEQGDYLKQLFQPLGFLSFLSPLHLVFALPDLLINLLSSNNKLYQIYYQYTAVISPFLFISGIYAVSLGKKHLKAAPLYLFSLYLVFATLYSAYQYGPLPISKKPNLDMFINERPNREEIKEEIEKIPRKSSVSASNNIASHLSQRENIYVLPRGKEKADYVVFLFEENILNDTAQATIAAELKENGEFNIVRELENFLLLKRN